VRLSAGPRTDCRLAALHPEKFKTLEIGSIEIRIHDRRVRSKAICSFALHDQQTFSAAVRFSAARDCREVNAGKQKIWGLAGELAAEPSITSLI